MSHHALGEFKSSLDKGELQWGLQNSSRLANRYLHGVHARYYLIGADSGVGKTTYADQYYVLEPIEYCMKEGIDLTVFYYSFEVSVKAKLSRWTSYYVWKMFGVMLPPDYIDRRIHGMTISPEHKALIDKAYEFVEKVCEYIVFIEDEVHPTKMFEDLVNEHYPRYGEVIRGKDTKDSKGKTRRGYVKGYIKDPKHKDKKTMVVVDHLALGGSESGLDTKGIMDRYSRYAVTLRNIFEQTTVYLQQFNTEMLESKRVAMSRKGQVTITPTRGDFGDSRYTYRDADVVQALVQPSKFELQEWKGFDLSEEALDNNMIAMWIMKNRYGPPDRIIPYFLNGITGRFTELPLKPLHAPIEMEQFYSQAKKIEQTCQLFSQSPENQ